VRVRDHREPERARQSAPARLALGREREHRLDQRLELERRTDLAEEPRLLVAGVPEPVRRARGHGHRVAGLRSQGLAADAQPERAREDVEALGLRRVDVRGGDEAVGLDDRLDANQLAAGLRCGLVEHEHLAGDGVLESVSWPDHSSLLSICVREDSVRADRGRRRRPAAGSRLPREHDPGVTRARDAGQAVGLGPGRVSPLS
jgi:hypothetical protein